MNKKTIELRATLIQAAGIRIIECLNKGDRQGIKDNLHEISSLVGKIWEGLVQ
jgi:hypothetical protein